MTWESAVIHPDNYQRPDMDEPQKVLAYARDWPVGHGRGWHSHQRAQLIHLIKGSLRVETEEGTWIVPPERAVWVPAFVEHQVTALTASLFRTLYVRAKGDAGLPALCSVVNVTPLLRELILALMKRPRSYDEKGADGRLAQVILDQIALSPEASLHLPMPQAGRLRRIAEALRTNPADTRGLDDWAREAAVSPRTFARRFTSETGMGFRNWRKQARLMRALELLADGVPVSDVSDRLGYEGPSAFIAMFRQAFGVTPGRYFMERT